MKRTVYTDPFFYNQPPLELVNELKEPLFKVKPDYYGKRPIEQNEIDVHGIYIAEKFPNDPENLLETIYVDFERFINIYEIGGNEKMFPVNLRIGETECFEAYIIEITDKEINITANDTEGIRRALIWLEDELRVSENAFLVPKTVKKKPYVRSRITRCFFSPINRAPKFGDELSDDVDYYPEEYLNRLMHEGSNGVWIYTRYSDLIPSSIVKEYGKGYEKRIEKLNRTIEKCRRYGIGVYVFAIEPKSLPEEYALNYPDMVGSQIYDKSYPLCCSSERARQFSFECGKLLVQMCPKLRGMISITYGERPTTCSSHIKGSLPTHGHPVDACCPRCSKLKNGQVLALALECLKSGTRAANPDFEVVSWTYGHRTWDMPDIFDYVDYAPDDVMLMQNFEDMGVEEQLGEPRLAEDYWLSYVGPSDMFVKSAERARMHGKHVFAKMQVCCSHEIASVPFVPVPGIIYKKYKAARELGVEGVMQCWYFGNYPSLMSKAAGELSFEGEFADECSFLERLAGIYFGRTKAHKVAEAWRFFEAGYRNYPINTFFSYYGPMHDSVVWKLSLVPKNFIPPRTWQLVDPIDGDRICDAMLTGHSLEEIRELCGIMCDNWEKGLSCLDETDCSHPDEKQIYNVCKAIGLLFNGGKNILEFYALRDDLGRRLGDPLAILSRMKELVLLEKENSLAMIPLCRETKCLGYHSESEGYKFFPEKILDRVSQLDTLMETEFTEIEKRIVDGKSPLEFYDGVEDCPHLKRYSMVKGSVEKAVWENVGESGKHKFRMSYDDSHLYIELYSETESNFLLCPEYRLTRADAHMHILPNGECFFDIDEYLYYQTFGKKAERIKAKYSNVKTFDDAPFHLVFTLNIADFDLDKVRPMRLKLVKDGEYWCREPEREQRPDTLPRATLGKQYVIPEDYGWIIPENSND